MTDEFTLQRTSAKDELPVYDVFVEGTKVGQVFQTYPTYERAPRGARIVTKRWTSKWPKWRYRLADRFARSWHINYDTRKMAVRRLIEEWEGMQE